MKPNNFDKKITNVKKIVPLTNDPIHSIPSHFQKYQIQYLYAWTLLVKTTGWGDCNDSVRTAIQ